MTKTETKTETETVVVIGDWFIDENWLVSKHQTHTSSYTGDDHFMSKQTLGDRMINLCGASEVYEILREHFNDKKLLGFGAWNKGDDNILKCILCHKIDQNNYKFLTPFTIRGPEVSPEKDHDKCLYNNNLECDFRQSGSHLTNLARDNKEVSTNRVIRKYEGYGNGLPHLIERTDFQIKFNEKDLNYDTITEELEKENVVAVIIEDHGRGVINNESIKKLIEVSNNSKIRFYVHSKVDNPKWLKELENKIIRLNVIDYRLAQHKKGQRRWQFGKEIGRASLEILGELTNDLIYDDKKVEPSKTNYNAKRAAVLLDNNTVIAKEKLNPYEEDTLAEALNNNIMPESYSRCYNIYKPAGLKQLLNIGRTTVFFSALIAQDIKSNFSNAENLFGKQCYKALKCAFEWSVKASDAWSADDSRFNVSYNKALDALQQPDPHNDLFEYSDYGKEWNEWDKSSKECGILTEEIKDEQGNTKTIKILELWRGEVTLKDYICVGGSKRSAINELVDSIYKFNRQKKNRLPLNSLLIARPGLGKSFLAERLAATFDMNYLEFSFSQMASNRDIIDCFDTICSVQNRTKKKVLVFMDEINCKVQGHSALGLLLSPIFGGSFVRDGKTYKLSPAVWIFASTDPLKILVDDKKINKGSDFVSRLNGPVIDFESFEKTSKNFTELINKFKNALILNKEIDSDEREFLFKHNASKTEQVYIGISLLNTYWGPISKIQKEVLELFQSILPINGFRSLEFFISRFQDVQHGIVFSSNVPSIVDFKELHRHVVLPENWTPTDENDDNKLVKIISRIE
jgi:hypothetical protein